ncbi:MAG: flagellar biosynthetic protein FliO [Terriglobales bacterium]
MAPVLPIEMEITIRETDDVELQSNSSVEEIPATPVLAFADEMVVDEEPAVEDKVHCELDLSPPPDSGMEIEGITEPYPDPALETIVPSETLTQSALFAEPENIRRTFAFQWNVFLQVLAKGWIWLQQHLKKQQAKKRLRVCESVSLGEKRFIAVVQVDGEQFLVGGSSSSVSTLAHLEQPREFSDVFRRYGPSGMQA